jgi:hypothetical protein
MTNIRDHIRVLRAEADGLECEADREEYDVQRVLNGMANAKRRAANLLTLDIEAQEKKLKGGTDAIPTER